MSPHTSIMPAITNGQSNQNDPPPPHMSQGPAQDAGCGTAEDCAIACSGIAAAIPQAMGNVENFRHMLALHDEGSSHHKQLALGLLHRFRFGAAMCQEVIEFLFVFRRAQVIEEIM